MKGILHLLVVALCLGYLETHRSHFQALQKEMDSLRSDLTSETVSLRLEMKNVTRQFSDDLSYFKSLRKKDRSRWINNKILEKWMMNLVKFMSGADRRISVMDVAIDGLEDMLHSWMGEVDERLQKVENTTNKMTRSRKMKRKRKNPMETPKDCHEVYRHGGMKFEGDYHILIKPDGAPEPFKVVCRLFNNSGWTVFQRRQDGSVDFYRSWEDYKVGFGDKHTEFWLGNDKLHYLTAQSDMMLRIEMQDWDSKKFAAIYDHFSIDNETKHYRLHVSGFHGNAGDSLTSHWENHDGMAFSTKDRDNDGRYYDSCAHHYHGAWWFNNCFDSHLNGKYYTKGFHRNYFQRDGIQWNSIHQYSSLKQVEMMIKPSERPGPTPKISNDL